MHDTRHPGNLRADVASETEERMRRAVGEVAARDRGIVAAAFPRWTYRCRAARRKLADIRARVARRILLITRAARYTSP